MMKVAPGYSRSCDKVRDHLMQNASTDVKQFLVKLNPARFIDPLKLKLKLKEEEETKTDSNSEEKKISAEENEDDEMN